MNYNDMSRGAYSRDFFDIFTRYTSIYIRNFTGADWKLKGYNIIGGHFDQYPPKEIKAGHMGGFSTSNGGLAYVQGPEGTLTYQGKINGVDTDIILYYMHPVGPSKSIYTITTKQENMVNWSLDPGDPTGWKQLVFVNVNKK